MRKSLAVSARTYFTTKYGGLLSVNRGKGTLASFMFIVLVLLVSACGNSNAGAGNDVSVNSSAASESSASNKPIESGPTVTLEYFQQKQEVVKIVDELIKKFEAENPNVKIKQNNVPNSGSVWQMRLSTNDAPILSTQLPHNPVYKQAAISGHMTDLTNEPFLQRVDQQLLKQNVDIDGKTYLMPIALATLGVYYNVDIFQSLGISIPTTYDELIQAAEKIKTAGITPFLFPDKSVTAVRQEASARLGIDVPDAVQVFTDVLDGKLHFTDHEGIRSWAEKIIELRKYGQRDTVGFSGDDAVREFSNGNSAMYFQGIWSIVPIQQNNPNLNFDMFPFPAKQAEDTKVSIIVDTAIGIASDAAHPDEAKKFIDFMSSPDNVQQYVDATQYPSAVQGVVNKEKKITRLTDLIEAGRTFPLIDSIFPKAEMRDEFAQAVQRLIVTKDVDAFLKELDTALYNKAKS
jgi:raffinose/stachyose/melibiose transport system substrate-binding protein